MWKNWVGDQACTPARYSRPGSIDEVQRELKQAAGAGHNVRVVGAGHSFGDNVLTSGTLMNLDALSGLHWVDKAAGEVRVAAGTRLYELNRLLAAEGLALANLGDIDAQSVAGAMSTGTHGTGIGLGNLATFVKDVELVTGTGELIQASEAGENVLEAARLSVGALGVITAYTLNVVPAFMLEGRQEAASLPGTLERLDELVDGHDHFEFYNFPHSETVILKSNNRVSSNAVAAASGTSAAGNSLRNAFQSSMVENTALDLISKLGRSRARLIPSLNRMASSLVTPTVRTDASYRVLASKRNVKFTESEWALPREACHEALKEMRRVITARGLAVNFPFEIRFVAGDEKSLLSPAYGRDSCYIAAHMYQGMEWGEYFSAVQDIALAHGGRPHWGKRHTLSSEALAALYPRWDDFLAVRDQLDPGRIFANDHLRRVFGD